ncbi:orotidine-5'-phosphate decarboxylase [Candidatus Acetothermia bacterium]|nr:orotidine-5'-phosphate decarboxylase [Candidatus Acetothermia bacterium]
MTRLDKRIREKIAQQKSRLVLALDLTADIYSLSEAERAQARASLLHHATEILVKTAPHLVAVKINYPLILALGLDFTAQLLSATDLITIGDVKIADIDKTAEWIARHLYGIGFDGLIAHPFVGFEKSLDGLFAVAREKERGVILVINMSHPGSLLFITPCTDALAEFAVQHSADGVIAPATRPADVKSARQHLGQEMLILSPGVGAQGARPGDAIRAGADLEIVGRAIYQADNPADVARFFNDEINDAYAEGESQ